MKFCRYLTIVAPLALTACTQDGQLSELFRPSTLGQPVKVVYDAPNRYQNNKVKTNHKTAKMPKVQQTATTRRINTTQCQDLDDWYLDGYRVGRSFTSQKEQMLQQRMSYCHFSQLPAQFKNNWERGFSIGYREGNVPTKSPKGKKKSKKA